MALSSNGRILELHSNDLGSTPGRATNKTKEIHMKTIAQQLNIKTFPFPFKIKNKNGNIIYYEDSDGFINNNRSKTCHNKIVTYEGKKYQLKEL